MIPRLAGSPGGVQSAEGSAASIVEARYVSIVKPGGPSLLPANQDPKAESGFPLARALTVERR